MATISKKYSFIWYGFCPGEGGTSSDCEDISLDSLSSQLHNVWQIDGNANAKAWIGGGSGTQSFTQLRCGRMYYIRLKDDVSSIDIPHAFVSPYGQGITSDLRLTSSCEATTPTPYTATETETETFTPNTPTLTDTVTDTESHTTTLTDTVTDTESHTTTLTDTVTDTESHTTTATESETSTLTDTVTDTESHTTTLTDTVTDTESHTTTATESETVTDTKSTTTATESTDTVTDTESPTTTLTDTVTDTESHTTTATESETSTLTDTVTDTESPTTTATESETSTLTDTVTDTESPTTTLTDTVTDTETETDEGPANLWIGFSISSGQSVSSSNFYQLESVSSQEVTVSDIHAALVWQEVDDFDEATNNTAHPFYKWNNSIVPNTSGVAVAVPTEPGSTTFVFDKTKHSATHSNGKTYNFFGGTSSGFNPSDFHPYFSDLDSMLNALHNQTVTLSFSSVPGDFGGADKLSFSICLI